MLRCSLILNENSDIGCCRMLYFLQSCCVLFAIALFHELYIMSRFMSCVVYCAVVGALEVIISQRDTNKLFVLLLSSVHYIYVALFYAHFQPNMTAGINKMTVPQD